MNRLDFTREDVRTLIGLVESEVDTDKMLLRKLHNMENIIDWREGKNPSKVG